MLVAAVTPPFSAF